MKPTDPASVVVPAPERSLEELYRRPGFLIRRAQQIAVSIFLEESTELGITTTRYGVMTILRARQSRSGGRGDAGRDRPLTTALVVGKLEANTLVERRADPPTSAARYCT